MYGLHSLGEVIALLNGERRFDATVPVDAEAFGVAECLCRGFRRRERTDGRKAGAGDRGGRRNITC